MFIFVHCNAEKHIYRAFVAIFMHSKSKIDSSFSLFYYEKRDADNALAELQKDVF